MTVWCLSAKKLANNTFDKRHLPELDDFVWHDIVRITAYKNNIPQDAKTCSPGRLKSGYTPEEMYRLCCKDAGYTETHNTAKDAADEFAIMRAIGIQPTEYPALKTKA